MTFDKIDALISLGYKFYGSEENGFTFYEGQIPPTEAEIDTELKRLEKEHSDQAYARKRQAEYPTIQQLVVALYDTDDKADIEAKRAEIKKKYPKPE